MIQYIPNQTLYGNRVALLPMGLRFCTERYLSWLNDPEVTAYLEINNGYTLKDLEEFILKNNGPKIYFWAILLRDSDLHIGNVKIEKFNESDYSCEFGILIGDKNYWGQGFAEEVSRLVLDFCFTTLKVKTVKLGLHPDNTSALKLYNKINFIDDGFEITPKGKFLRMKCSSNSNE